MFRLPVGRPTVVQQLTLPASTEAKAGQAVQTSCKAMIMQLEGGEVEVERPSDADNIGTRSIMSIYIHRDTMSAGSIEAWTTAATNATGTPQMIPVRADVCHGLTVLCEVLWKHFASNAATGGTQFRYL
jgi:hypothetical protein